MLKLRELMADNNEDASGKRLRNPKAREIWLTFKMRRFLSSVDPVFDIPEIGSSPQLNILLTIRLLLYC